MTEVRCPMRECRRRIDLEARGAGCMHLIVAWRGGDMELARAVGMALAGNREFIIRNVRPEQVPAEQWRAHAAEIASAVRSLARVVDDVAVFGDQHERDAIARTVAQVLYGPDPNVRQPGAWSPPPGSL